LFVVQRGNVYLFTLCSVDEACCFRRSHKRELRWFARRRLACPRCSCFVWG